MGGLALQNYEKRQEQTIIFSFLHYICTHENPHNPPVNDGVLITKPMKWTDDCWPLLLQVYLRKPVGVKPLYSRALVELALELHVHPRVLFNKQCELASLPSPSVERLWQTYADSPRRLRRAVSLLRAMRGFSHADTFYEGVELSETFEPDFRPIAGCEPLTPVMLVLVLDLYFRLTPATMVAETPEVAGLARTMRVPVAMVVGALAAFQHCDPYLKRSGEPAGSMAAACRQVWQRYGNRAPDELAAIATQLREYFVTA